MGDAVIDTTPSYAGDGLHWLARPYELLREKAREHGDVFPLDLGAYGRYELFSHPRALRRIFTADSDVLEAGEGNAVLRELLGASSLLLLQGSRHVSERRLLLPAFQSRAIDRYADTIRTVALETIEEWQPGCEVNIHHAMQSLSLEVILRAVFGMRDPAGRADLKALLQPFLNDPKLNLALVGSLDTDLESVPSWRGFRERHERIHALIDEQVRCRRREPEGRDADMLGMLLAARYDDGGRLTGEALRDELLTLLVTGYETTATALAWSFHWLHRGGSPDRWIGPDPEDPRVEAACKEVLRIHPVIPVVARRVRTTIDIEGYRVEPGTTVAPCIFLTHHRPELYPEPDTFQPERFLRRRFSPYQYLPFGGGARRCVGMPMAMLEMKTVLATVLARRRLVPVHSTDGRPVRRSVTVAPSGGPVMRVEEVRG